MTPAITVPMMAPRTMVDNRVLVMVTAIGDNVSMSPGKFGGTVEIKMAPMMQTRNTNTIMILLAVHGVMVPVKGRMAIGMSDG